MSDWKTPEIEALLSGNKTPDGMSVGQLALAAAPIARGIADLGFVVEYGAAIAKQFLALSRERDAAVQRAAPTSLNNLRDMKQGWDTYGAPPINEKAIAVAESILNTKGQAVPCSSGGVQIEWHCAGVDVEIVILPDGTIEDEAMAVVQRAEAAEKSFNNMGVAFDATVGDLHALVIAILGADPDVVEEYDLAMTAAGYLRRTVSTQSEEIRTLREALEQAKTDFDTIAYAHSIRADLQTINTLRGNWQHTFDAAWNGRSRVEDAINELSALAVPQPAQQAKEPRSE